MFDSNTFNNKRHLLILVAITQLSSNTYYFVKIRNYKLPGIGKQLPTFPHKVMGLNSRPQSGR